MISVLTNGANRAARGPVTLYGPPTLRSLKKDRQESSGPTEAEWFESRKPPRSTARHHVTCGAKLAVAQWRRGNPGFGPKIYSKQQKVLITEREASKRALCR